MALFDCDCEAPIPNGLWYNIAKMTVTYCETVLVWSLNSKPLCHIFSADKNSEIKFVSIKIVLLVFIGPLNKAKKVSQKML